VSAVRVVLFHFHLFKNAGTSVDKILEDNFGDKFVKREFAFHPYNKNVEEVKKWILEEKDKVAFSSHTARLFNFEQFEKEHNVKIIPIIFVRHPIVRIHSAYYFEREKQKHMETLGPVIARNTTLKGYIEIRWVIPNDYQCQNFHVHRFADFLFYKKIPPLDKALTALDSLPFVGLVENFDLSIKHLENIIKPYFPEFKGKVVKANVMFSHESDLLERLENIKKELGDFYQKVVDRNEEDLILWNKIKERYNMK